MLYYIIKLDIYLNLNPQSTNYVYIITRYFFHITTFYIYISLNFNYLKSNHREYWK